VHSTRKTGLTTKKKPTKKAVPSVQGDVGPGSSPALRWGSRPFVTPASKGMRKRGGDLKGGGGRGEKVNFG